MSGDESGLRIEIAEDGGGSGPGRVRRRVLGGRRRRNAGDGRRQNQVNVRLTDEEFTAVAARAAATRVGVAHYVALRALDAPTRAGSGGGAMDLATMQAWAIQMTNLRRELARVGTNLNQIARLLNATGEVARGAERTLAATEEAMARVGPVADWVAQASGMVEP